MNRRNFFVLLSALPFVPSVMTEEAIDLSNITWETGPITWRGHFIDGEYTDLEIYNAINSDLIITEGQLSTVVLGDDGTWTLDSESGWIE